MKVIGNLTKDAIIRAAVSQGSSATEAVGSETVFESANTSIIASVYDSNANKTAIFYKDQGNSNYGTAIIGTVSGTSISYGSPVVFYAATANYIDAAFDSNSNKIVVVYNVSGTNHGAAIVGTVSGTSISFGSPVVYNAATTAYTSVVFDSSNNKIVICYQDGGNSNHGTAIVGTVSGTSISFGSETVFESATTAYISTTFDSNSNKVVIGYQDVQNSDHGTAIVGTVSGTSISFGSATVFESAAAAYIQTGFDSTNNKVVIAYQDSDNSYYGTAIVGTVSGTGISFGTAVVFQSSQANTYGVAHDSNAQKNVIFFRDQTSTAKGTVIVGTVSGTSISFNTKTAVNDGYAGGHTHNAVYDSTAQKVVLTYKDDGNNGYGTAVVYQTGYTKATGGTIADGKAVIVNANGTVSSVSQEASSAGTAAVYNSGSTGRSAVGYDPVNKKIVIVYKDAGNSNYGTAIVGTVDASNKSISFGSEVVFESASSDHFAIAFDTSAQKFLIVYEDSGNSSYGTGIVGTVSGTSISFGTPTVFASKNPTIRIATDFDTNAGKFLVCFADGQNSYAGDSVVGTISGTSVSFGSGVNFNNANTPYINCVFDPDNNKFGVFYKDTGDGYAHGKIGTISGTSVSYTSEQDFNSATVGSVSAVYDTTNNKFVVGYNASGGKVRAATSNGSTFSFETEASFSSTESILIQNAGVFDTASGKTAFLFREGNDSYNLKVVNVDTSTSTPSFDSVVDLNLGTSADAGGGYDSDGNRVVFSGIVSSTGKTQVYAIDPKNLTSENFIGFMKGAALDGTNGEILSSCSIARNQTSLTPGQTYFVSPTDGALSTTAGSPSVTAGTAISSTELIVKG